MTDKDKKTEFLPDTQLDRRDLLTGAAGMAAALFGGQAVAGAHRSAPIELTAEDKIAKPVGEGAQVLVTGANRGLGFEFTKQYAARGAKVIATARKPERAEALNALAAENPNIVVERLDVTDHAQIEELAAKYVDTPIDLLLNNAGIGGGIEPRYW